MRRWARPEIDDATWASAPWIWVAATGDVGEDGAMAISHLPSDTSPEDVAAMLRRDGATIVDHLAPGSLLDRIHVELEPYFDATPGGPDSFSGRLTRRTGALVARSPSCRELVTHPLAVETARGLLSQATNIQLHLTQAIAIGAGETAQPIHRDQWAFDFFPFPRGYDVQCNTIWALTDFTEENGATRVVVGSNMAEDGAQFESTDTEPAVMGRGSVLLYSGSVYHGGGANRSSSTRVGLNITYNVAWLRQEENQYLSVPREVAETLPTDLLRLMGYDRGAYALGYIDDLRDPVEAVRPGVGSIGFAAAHADDG
jgi:Phytanoyl-CoA dioxygenase (PhyH)